MINQTKPKQLIDARNLINRKQIDAANIPVLFVELASGQNGTLTPYPGQGVGQTWLGADGATITLERGILKASRGMGDDLMGSSSSMPPWSKINKKTKIIAENLTTLAETIRFLSVFLIVISKKPKAESLSKFGM